MGAVIASAVGGLLVGGVLLTLAGLRGEVPVKRNAPSITRRIRVAWQAWDRRRRSWVVGVVAAGLLIAIVTGWLVAALLIPALLIGIPYLLSAPPNHEVEILAALDRWVRFLGPSIATGKSIRDAIIATRSQAPPRLATPVARTVARMDLGWTTHDALLAMADELDSADADGILAALAIASSLGGIGARQLLAALAENSQLRLRALREIAAERSKPRAVVRQVVAITLGILVVVWFLSPGYFAPYATPVGQLIAVGLVALYIGALVMLRRRILPQPTARFLKARS